MRGGESTTPSSRRSSGIRTAIRRSCRPRGRNRKEELAPYAESALEVANLFQEPPVASERAIYDAIRRGLPPSASVADLGDAFRDFRNLGLFWREPGAMGFYRPAIPSLMASIREGLDSALLKARR